MLPEPMMATFVRCVMLMRPPWSAGEAWPSTVPRPVMSARTCVAGRDRDHRAERAGQHDLAGAQRVAEVDGRSRASQARALQRVAEAGGAGAASTPASPSTDMVIATSAGSNVVEAAPGRRRGRTGRWRRCRRRCRRR